MLRVSSTKIKRMSGWAIARSWSQTQFSGKYRGDVIRKPAHCTKDDGPHPTNNNTQDRREEKTMLYVMAFDQSIFIVSHTKITVTQWVDKLVTSLSQLLINYYRYRVKMIVHQTTVKPVFSRALCFANFASLTSSRK